MKRKVNSLSHQARILRIYREDLEEIERILRDDLEASHIKFSTLDYEYDGVGEIPSNIEAVHNFDIKTVDPYVSISLGQLSSRVWFEKDSLKELGAFTKIVELLEKRERKFLHYSTQASSWLAPIIVILGLFGAARLVNIWSWPLLLCSLLAIVWYVSAYKTEFNRHSTIELANEIDRPSFLKKNKDSIIISSISTVIGAILGVIATLLFKGQ